MDFLGDVRGRDVDCEQLALGLLMRVFAGRMVVSGGRLQKNNQLVCCKSEKESARCNPEL